MRGDLRAVMNCRIDWWQTWLLKDEGMFVNGGIPPLQTECAHEYRL